MEHRKSKPRKAQSCSERLKNLVKGSFEHFSTPQYHDFIRERENSQRSLVQGIRLWGSIVIITYLIVIIPISEDVTTAEYVIVPTALIVKFIITTFALRFHRFYSLSIIFMINFLAQFFFENTLENNLSANFAIFMGVRMGMFFCIIFLAKMPYYYICLSTLVIFIHIIIRLFLMEMRNKIPMFCFFFRFWFYLNLFYIRKERIDFDIYISKQKPPSGDYNISIR